MQWQPLEPSDSIVPETAKWSETDGYVAKSRQILKDASEDRVDRKRLEIAAVAAMYWMAKKAVGDTGLVMKELGLSLLAYSRVHYVQGALSGSRGKTSQGILRHSVATQDLCTTNDHDCLSIVILDSPPAAMRALAKRPDCCCSCRNCLHLGLWQLQLSKFAYRVYWQVQSACCY